jgi:hypothetical protein
LRELGVAARSTKNLSGFAADRPMGLKLDDAKQSQDYGPEARTQQYSCDCPARSTVSPTGRFCQLRRIIAVRTNIFIRTGTFMSFDGRRADHLAILVHF